MVTSDAMREAVDRLVELCTERAGHAIERVRREAIEQAVRALLVDGTKLDDLVSRAYAGHPEALDAICAAACVGETYFFRQPEHFEFLARDLLPALMSDPTRRVLRAWSAACATGEEAYSLAACLTACAPAFEVSVLGTDLLERRVRFGEQGRYERWSVRDTAPAMFPLFEPTLPGERQVLQRLRDVTRFRRHNLLEPLPPEEGCFDIIFCRNVLGYFAPDAVRTACGHLDAALAPDGVVVFAPVDPVSLPDGYAAVGRAELQVFRGVPAKRVSLRPRPPQPEPAFPPPSQVHCKLSEPTTVTKLHHHVLEHLERGELRLAEQALRALRSQAPNYVPGIFEQALFLARTGRRLLAADAMRDVLRRTDRLPPEALLDPASELPVSYYRAGARAFLEGRRDQEERSSRGQK